MRLDVLQIGSHDSNKIFVFGTFVFSWDLKDNTGMKMQNGTYLCKVLLSADGENFAEETKKIVILSQ